MTESAPLDTPPENTFSRARSVTIAAVAFLLLAAPFLVLGLLLLDLKARVELQCTTGGPCTLTRSSWLTHEVLGTFTVNDLEGATVERSRSTRGDEPSIFRPVLLTKQGQFPLSYQWMEEEQKAARTAKVVNLFRANPLGKGFTLWHDDRRTSARVGGAFTAVGGVLLGVSGWLALRARRHLRVRRPASSLQNP